MRYAITADDVPSIVEALQALRLESPNYNEVPNDPHLVGAKLTHAFDTYMFGLIDYHADGRLIGFMFGAIAEPWYSAKQEAHEQLLYIDPRFRGSHYVARLVREFECLCKVKGAERLYVGASLGIMDQRVEHMYEVFGYRWIGRSLAKDL